MSQANSDPSGRLLNQKAPEEANMKDEEPRDPKHLRICPRAILESLSDWRIQSNTISFSETGTRKQGASADVELATIHLSPVEQLIYSRDILYVAVKRFRLCDNRDDERVLASLAHEISLISKLRSHNVIQLRGFAENLVEGIAWIILPWEANGNVREFLNSESWEIPERVSLIYDISCGVKYLHTRDPPICHGDLKPANVLMNSRNRAVITDFGSARLLGEPTVPESRVRKATRIPSKLLTDKQAPNTPRVELKSLGTLITLTGTAWTLRWAAPELVNDENPGLGSDIWAFTWICWEIMTGNIPFHDEPNDMKLALQLATLDFNLPSTLNDKHLSQIDSLCNLMNKCWNLDVARRPSASVCVSEIMGMDPVIPSARSAPGSGDVRSVELLNALGNLDLKNGKTAEAIQRFKKALGIARSSQDMHGEAVSLLHLGDIRYTHDDAAGAEASYAEARHIYGRTGDQLGISRAYRGLGMVQCHRNKYTEAENTYIVLRKIYSQIGNQAGAAYTCFELGRVQLLLDKYTQSEASYLEAREIYNQIGDKLGVANGLMGAAEAQHLQHEYHRAEESYVKAHELYDRIGDQLGVANATRGLGDIQRLQSQYSKAEASYVKVLKICDRIGDKLGMANVTLGPGDVRYLQSERSKAGGSFVETREIYDWNGCQLGIAHATLGLGDVQYHQNDYSKAEASYAASLEIYNRIGDQLGVANATRGLGDVQYHQNDYSKAEASYAASLEIYNQIGDRLGVANATQGLGDVQYHQNDYSKASASYAESLGIYNRIGDQLGVANATRRLGDIQRLRNEYPKAEASYLESLEIYSRIGHKLSVANVTLVLGDVRRLQSEAREV